MNHPIRPIASQQQQQQRSFTAQKATISTWRLTANRHCLDLRPTEAYSKAHLVPSTSIPLDTLEQRFSQLPPKTPPTPFLLLTHEDAAFNGQPVAPLLTARGWTISGVVELPPDEDVDDFWDHASDLGTLGTGNEGTELLFRPSPVLSAWISWIEESIRYNGYHPLENRVLDIGCGSGRDMGFLVSRQVHWHVFGLDNWPKALQRAQVMVKSINPNRFGAVMNAEINETTGAIMHSPDDQQKLRNFFERPFYLILIIRFFPRKLFKYIERYVDTGGYLIFSHFTDPPEGQKNYESPPKEKRVRPGEVEELLLRKGWPAWQIMQGAYSTSEDGRAMWDVVARRL